MLPVRLQQQAFQQGGFSCAEESIEDDE